MDAATTTPGRDVVHESSGSADVADFDLWVAARGPALVRFAWLVTGERAEAEDIVQEALSRALPRWRRISRVDDPEAYVRRMIVNGHVSWWRKFRRRESPVAEVSDDFSQDEGNQPQGRVDDRLAVWHACRHLTADQRVAVVLRYYEDLSYARIAEITGVREGTARARVSRGLTALRDELGGIDD